MLDKHKEITLTEDQELAFDDIATWLHTDERFKTLSGFAGSGKTVLMDYICDYAKSEELEVIFTAPTNKAVRVLGENVDHDIMSTIHSLLNIKVKREEDKELFEPVWKKEHNINAYDLVVVDECSMVSEKLLSIIEEQVKYHDTKILFVGDSAQLQPVGETISKTFNFNPVTLTKIVRYGNVIANQAKKVRNNKNFVALNSLVDPPTIDVVEEYELKDLFYEFRKSPDKIRMGCWTNNAVKHWNNKLRNFDYDRVVEEAFVVGDIVIANEPCEVNNEIVMANSEEGKVIRVGEHFDSYELTLKLMFGSTVTVRVMKDDYKNTFYTDLKKFAMKKNWTGYWNLKKKYHDIRHCYAMTIHKHQGSTYDNIVLNSPDMMLNKNIEERNQLIYVGMTRARNSVLIFNGF